MKPFNKKSEFNKEDVINKVVKLRLEDCASTKTIIDILTNELGYGKTMAYEYLKLARERIKEQFSLLNPAMIEEAVGQYEEAIEGARRRKDWRMWNDLRKELNKIQGIYATQKIDLTSGGEKLTEIKLIQVNKKDELEGGTGD